MLNNINYSYKEEKYFRMTKIIKINVDIIKDHLPKEESK
jgi:hypothetical protein